MRTLRTSGSRSTSRTYGWPTAMPSDSSPTVKGGASGWRTALHTFATGSPGRNTRIRIRRARGAGEARGEAMQSAQSSDYPKDPIPRIAAERVACPIVGNSWGLRQALEQVEVVAPTDATVLVLGETR